MNFQSSNTSFIKSFNYFTSQQVPEGQVQEGKLGKGEDIQGDRGEVSHHQILVGMPAAFSISSFDFETMF